MKHPLLKYLEDRDESHSSFAEKVGTTRQTIFRICKNKNKPSAKLAVKIVEQTGGALTFEELFMSETAA